MIKDLNELIAAVAKVSAETELGRVEHREAVANKAKEKLNHKKKQEEELATKKAELLPGLQSIMAEYETGRAVAADLNKLTVQMLINIIHYYYDLMPKGLSLMKKSDLVSEVAN